MQQYFSRKMDELGRIVLPMELRKLADIQVGDLLDITCDDGKHIQICARQQRCAVCGANENLREAAGRNICEACVAKIKAM